LYKVHGDYSEDVGTKVERPAEETVVEGTPEIVGA
jgi:small subunit ribosomal protein S3Ae